MYCLLKDITEDFEPDLHDDGSARAPAMRTFFTFDALQKVTVALRLMRHAIDVLHSSWAEHTRCTPLTPTDSVSAGLVRLMNGSRSLYASCVQLVYADNVFRNGPEITAPRTDHFGIVTRCNPLLEYNILIGGISTTSVEALKSVSDEDLLFSCGYYVVGSKSGSNILSFNQATVERDLLNDIHNAAGTAIQEIETQLATMRSIAGEPMTVGAIVDIWRRVSDEIHSHSPLPFGVEPGENYRIGL